MDKQNQERPEQALDRAIEEIRSESIDQDTIDAAANRVWERLASSAHIHGCSDFQALLPAYYDGSLIESKALLVKDHLRECVKCRKSLDRLSHKVQPIPVRKSWTTPRWAIAAAVLIGVVSAGWGVKTRFDAAPVATSFTVEAMDGALYRATPEGLELVKVGTQLPGGADVQTARLSNAVLKLRDGSVVEMRERSSLSVSETRSDMTIHVDRGSVIVQAAKRSRGRLYVATPDCKVAVKGTVFAVNKGVRGSRVSVVEGEVQVRDASVEKLLYAGQQHSTDAGLTPVPVQEEIAWSRNLSKHTALLKEFAGLQRDLSQIRMPGLRYSSRLLSKLPADTVVFAALPNLAGPLAEAEQLLESRMAESPVLREWWQQSQRGIMEVMARVRGVSQYIGDEIVITAQRKPDGGLDFPVVIADVTREGLREFLQSDMDRHGIKVRIVDNVADILASGKKEVLLVGSGLIAASPEGSALHRVVSGVADQAPTGFAGTPFHSRIESAYREGASILVAADLERISERAHVKGMPPGFAAVRHFVLEQQNSQAGDQMRATLTFSGERQGVASWLGRPAPIAGLDYISPEATVVAAFNVKEPAAMFDDLSRWLEAMDPNVRRHIEEGEAKTGVRVRDDIVAALGAEFVAALDGPLLPVPSWRFAIEVYNPGKLQSSLERLSDACRAEAAAHGRTGPTLTTETVNGRTYYVLKTAQTGPLSEIHYSYTESHLVASPTRTQLDRAIEQRASGQSIAKAAGFRALLPRDRHMNFSAVVYQNAGSAIGPLVDALGSAKGLTEDQRSGIASLAREIKASAMVAYGDTDRITVASTSDLLSLSLPNWLGASSPSLLGMLEGGRRGTK